MLIENPLSFPTGSDFRIRWLAKPNLLPASHVLYGLINAEDNLPTRHPMSAHEGWTQMGWAASVPGDPAAGRWGPGGGLRSGPASLAIRSPPSTRLFDSVVFRGSGGRCLLSTHLGLCCNAGAYHCTQLLCCKPVSCGHKGEERSQLGAPRPPCSRASCPDGGSPRHLVGLGTATLTLSGAPVVASILA